MRRHLLWAFAIVACVFGGGLMLRDWALPHAPALQPGAALEHPVAAPPVPLTVTALHGVVELRTATTATWQPLTPDLPVRDHDALRTGDGASATLAVGDGLQFDLAEKSQFTLTRLAHEVSSILLENGRIAAQVRGGKMRVQVTVDGNDAVVDSGGQPENTSFSVLRCHDARVSVATTAGSVRLQANEQRVDVQAGTQSVVAAHGAPSAPFRIPASLFLKVARSGPARVNRRETDVTGSTTPGAEVFVNGLAAPVDDEGKFKAHVPLREGVNALQVTAHDALGRVQEQALPDVHVDTQAPKLAGQVVW